MELMETKFALRKFGVSNLLLEYDYWIHGMNKNVANLTEMYWEKDLEDDVYGNENN